MVRIGLAGIGYVAEEYIKQITSGLCPDLLVSAMCSRNRAHMEEVKERYQLDARIFTDYEEMLSSGCIDAVAICTPHLMHIDMAIKAIRRGVHTLIEKPIGVFPQELDALSECLKMHPEVVCGVLFCRRTSQAYTKLRQMIPQVGDIKRVTWIVTNMYRTQAYHNSQSWRGTYHGEAGGMLMTQTSHQLDLLVWLCGLPSAVQAHLNSGKERRIEVENEATIYLEYPNGAIGHFIADTHEVPGTCRLEIIGNLGQLILEGDRTLTWRKLEQDEHDYAVNSPEIYGTIPWTEEVTVFDKRELISEQAGILNNFASAVEHGTPLLCPAEDGIRTQRLIQAAYLSGWTGKKVFLPADGESFTAHLRSRMNGEGETSV